MKQTKLTLFLLALAIMLIAPSTVKTRPQTKPTTDFTLYYWFDADNNYLYRQCRIDEEKALTGLDESLQNPKTLWEKGYAPASVAVGEWGVPVPITSFPDKSLYSHP
jgi:hypothetical protein